MSGVPHIVCRNGVGLRFLTIMCAQYYGTRHHGKTVATMRGSVVGTLLHHALLPTIVSHLQYLLLPCIGWVVLSPTQGCVSRDSCSLGQSDTRAEGI